MFDLYNFQHSRASSADWAHSEIPPDSVSHEIRHGWKILYAKVGNKVRAFFKSLWKLLISITLVQVIAQWIPQVPTDVRQLCLIPHKQLFFLI